MTWRKLFSRGASVGACSGVAALLVSGVQCQGDPLYLGPIEITGSVDSDSDDAGGGSTPPPQDSGVDVDAGQVVVDAGGADASDTVVACSISDAEPSSLALPVVIDDYFAPSGWAGDAASGGLAVPECDRDREPGAEGNCHLFEYTPMPPAIPGSASWAGVFFQYPEGNWGEYAGLSIAPGAQRVSFLAAGASGGEIVTFRAGGIGDPNAGTCADEFDRDVTVRLSQDFQRYEIDLQDAPYSRVISPFSWKISKVLFSGESPETISFYLDDLHWE